MSNTAESGRHSAPETPLVNRITSQILGSSWLIVLFAMVIAVLIGSVLIAATDSEVQRTSAYFFGRPGDFLSAVWQSVSGAYVALFHGAIFNPRRPELLAQLTPLSESLTLATPLIMAGLGAAITFRVGMFNIGGRGQILIAAAAAGWVGWSFPMPPLFHVLIATAVAFIAGGLWGGLAGFIKARTGAHEVILTIMLNYVAFYLIAFLLKTPGALQAPGSTQAKSPATLPSAVYPSFSQIPEASTIRLHIGFLFAVLATLWVWYLLSRSSLGFRMRAVGENPRAAQVAGINVKLIFVVTMLFSGGLMGLAGASQVLGSTTTGFSDGIDAGIGFDALTVALLGKSRPWGVFGAGLLFGALKAGSFTMRAREGIPVDIVLVVQSVIVLLIAAPPLVRAIFRLPVPGITRVRKVKKVLDQAGVVQ